MILLHCIGETCEVVWWWGLGTRFKGGGLGCGFGKGLEPFLVFNMQQDTKKTHLAHSRGKLWWTGKPWQIVKPSGKIANLGKSADLGKPANLDNLGNLSKPRNLANLGKLENLGKLANQPNPEIWLYRSKPCVTLYLDRKFYFTNQFANLQGLVCLLSGLLIWWFAKFCPQWFSTEVYKEKPILTNQTKQQKLIWGMTSWATCLAIDKFLLPS